MQPQHAPILVAATLAHNIEMYSRHSIAITETSLAYSYNPPDKRILPTNNDLAIDDFNAPDSPSRHKPSQAVLAGSNNPTALGIDESDNSPPLRYARVFGIDFG